MRPGSETERFAIKLQPNRGQSFKFKGFRQSLNLKDDGRVVGHSPYFCLSFMNGSKRLQ